MVGPAGVSELIGTSGNVYFELIGNACNHNLAATARNGTSTSNTLFSGEPVGLSVTVT